MADPNYYLIGPIEADSNEFMLTYNDNSSGHNLAYFLTIIEGTGTGGTGGTGSDTDQIIFDPRNRLTDDGGDNGGDVFSCELSPQVTSALTTFFNAKCASTNDCTNIRNSTQRTQCEAALKQCLINVPAQITDVQNRINEDDPRCLNPTTSNDIPIGKLLILTASSTSGGWNFSYASGSNTQYLGVDSNNIIVPSDDPVTFVITQNTVTPWDGVPFLAGVNYGLQANGKNVAFKTYSGGMSTNGDAIISTFTNAQATTTAQILTYNGTFRALPTTTYYNGTVGGNTGCHPSGSTPVLSTATVRNIEAAWAATGIGPPSFTNSSDCQVGNRYRYCTNNNLCGTGGCKGPCSLTDDSRNCQYDSSSTTYVCRKPSSNKPFYLQVWFILLMCLFGILLVIGVILLIVRFEGPRAKARNTATVTKFSTDSDE